MSAVIATMSRDIAASAERGVQQTIECCTVRLQHEIAQEWACFAEPVRRGWTMIVDELAIEMETKNG